MSHKPKEESDLEKSYLYCSWCNLVIATAAPKVYWRGKYYHATEPDSCVSKFAKKQAKETGIRIRRM